MLQLCKSIGAFFHGKIARWPWLAVVYLKLASASVRRLPDNIVKDRFVNSLHGAKWPAVDFPPKRIQATAQTQIAIVPHLGEFDQDALFYKQLKYEREMFVFLEGNIDKYDAVLEIGANVGVFSVFFFQVMKRHQKIVPVFAFEPSQEAYRRLLQNLAANRAHGVRAFNCAVAEVTGFVNFYEPEGHLTNGSLSKDFAEAFSSRTVSRPVVALDGRMLARLVENYERLLIKIDVEGAEAEVLKSLEGLITDKHPDLIIEVLPGYEEKLNALNFLAQRYQYHSITDKGLQARPNFVAAGDFRDYFLSTGAQN